MCGRSHKILTQMQAIVAALEPPATRETNNKKKGKKCTIL